MSSGNWERKHENRPPCFPIFRFFISNKRDFRHDRGQKSVQNGVCSSCRTRHGVFFDMGLGRDRTAVLFPFACPRRFAPAEAHFNNTAVLSLKSRTTEQDRVFVHLSSIAVRWRTRVRNDARALHPPRQFGDVSGSEHVWRGSVLRVSRMLKPR
jgi:hypothetical protein